MVRKETTYWCGKCNTGHRSRKKAEECERKEPTPVAIHIWQKQNALQLENKTDWKIGDVVAFPGSGPLFGKITGTEVKNHLLFPVYTTPDGRVISGYSSLGSSFALFLGEPELKELQTAIVLSIEAKAQT